MLKNRFYLFVEVILSKSQCLQVSLTNELLVAIQRPFITYVDFRLLLSLSIAYLF